MTEPDAVCLHPEALAAPSRRSPPGAALIGWLALALLMPNPARAEVCDKERPFWDSATGQATALDEALHLAASPLTLALLVATALAVRFRSSWAGLAVVCGWSGLVALITFYGAGDTEIRRAAIAEGCIGSPALFIALVAAISVATVIYTSPRPARED